MAEELDNSSSISKESTEQTEANSSKKNVEGIDKSSLRYEDGKCFYTDSSTGAEYEWKEDKQQWEAKPASEKDYTHDGETYYYTDKNTGVKYKWDKENNQWGTFEGSANVVPKLDVKVDVEEEEMDSEDEEKTVKKVVRQDMSKGTYGTDGNTLTYTDPNDGTVYLWDKEKSAWFPKIDDDFLAQYQLSYGFSNPEGKEENKTSEPETKKIVEEKPPAPEDPESLKRKAEEPTWFEVSDDSNNKVYVSNLPTDITETEFVELMQKCGLVMKDPDTGKMKVKLYTEPKTDVLKGDALCTYIKVESVNLALTLLDGYEFRGKKLHVERAKFTMKGGAYDPSLRPKKKKRKDKEKIKKMQEKLFDWRPEKPVNERAKHERVVIVKNLFEPKIFDKDVGLILEYQEDLRDECRKCGDVRKVVVYDRHPEGVAQITFREFEGAEACVQLLDGRWFGQRQITAQIWDGKTKYKIVETEAEIAERIEKWDRFLDNESEEDKEKRESRQKKSEEEQEKGKVESMKGEEGKAKTKEDDRDSDGTRSSAGSGDETDDGT